MGRSKKKPRPRMDPRQVEWQVESQKKKERDWTFEDIVRSKKHHR